MSDTVIKVENLSKKYILSHQGKESYTALRDVMASGAKSLGKKLLSPFTSHVSHFTESHEEFYALRDVSFEIRQGDRVGIIGRNGAGKSTLLKILSRITEPTSGRIEITGRVASLLEVGTGFHPELTGRENIFLNGAILGMGKAEIKRKFDEIVDFAEVEKFLDTPVKRYSSGMYVRLAFAVAAHLEPEILVVDEVLAVGDAQFQKKCLGKMEDVSAKEGRTVLFVSHNMGAIRQLCSSCIWLNSGIIVEEGSSVDTIDHYLRAMVISNAESEVTFEENLDKEFQIRHARLLDRHDTVSNSFTADDCIVIELNCQVNSVIPGLYGYMTLDRTDGITLLESDSYDIAPNQLDDLAVGIHILRIVIPQRILGVGDYLVYLSFASASGLKRFDIDSPGHILSFNVDDPVTLRGNNRNGFLSTCLKWDVISDVNS